MRRVVGLLALAALAWAVYDGIPSIWDRVLLLHYQQQCFDYAVPAGTPLGAAHAPDCWVNLWKAAHVGDARSNRILYLHHLRSPDGTERLVAIFQPRVRMAENEMLYPSRLFWLSVTPAGWRTGPLVARTSVRTSPLERADLIGRRRTDRPEDYDPVLSAPQETFTAGPIDAADPSHFTIRYRVQGWEIRESRSAEWQGADGVIDGWLEDDGTLRMRFTRTAAIAAPATVPDASSGTVETADTADRSGTSADVPAQADPQAS